jgi:hypothetical protein
MLRAVVDNKHACFGVRADFIGGFFAVRRADCP